MNRRLMMQRSKWNYIRIEFTVTSTTELTQIISDSFEGLDDIDYITFNFNYGPTKYEPSKTFQFTSTGTRIGFIHFKSSLTDLTGLFHNITIITLIDMNNLNTTKVTSMTNMCLNCATLVQILMSECRADNLTSMVNMFNSCTVLKYVDFGSYINGKFKPTSKLTDIRNMFNWCKTITSINMSMFDLSGVTLWGYTFGNCTKLSEIYMNSPLNSGATFTTNMFVNSTTSGATLYYNSTHDYSAILNVKGSNWTLKTYNY